MKKIALKNAARGTAFDYAGQSWILLENDDGRALCLSKDIIETRAFDEGNCNNFAVASSKEYLNGAYLDNLLEDVNGPNAFLTTELDLTTDDGLKDYGTCTVTIFLLTVDQYRRNRDVIPNADDWWWLSTAFSTKSNGYSLMYYEKQGRYHAKDPKPGDQIFFSTAHSKSNVSHTGLVEKVDGSKVYTIEGNTSDQVARRSYYLSDSYIVGYGRPAYDVEPGNANAGSQTPSNGTTSEVTYTVVAGDTLSKIAAKYGTTYQKLAAYNGITNPNIIRVGQKIKIPGTAAPKKTNAELAKEVIAGKWGNGADRKKRLEAAGYDYNTVQQAVNAALAR